MPFHVGWDGGCSQCKGMLLDCIWCKQMKGGIPMTEKKRYTVILRGDIRAEVETNTDLVTEFAVEDGICDSLRGVGFAFRMSDVVAVLESSAITTPTYEPVVQTEESEFEASERARKERGE